MGIFFTQPEQFEAQSSGAHSPKPSKKFEPFRAGLFILLVIIVIIAGLWAGKNGLTDWSTALIHVTECFSGIAVGIFIGEASSK